MMEQLHKLSAEKLKKHQIKPSVHRIMVYEYLMTQQNHPTVEQIFLHLRQDFPTISKATIYNTLNLFVEVGLVRISPLRTKRTGMTLMSRITAILNVRLAGRFMILR